MKIRNILVFISFILLTAIVFAFNIFGNIPNLSLSSIFYLDFSETQNIVLSEFRIPKAITAILVGAGLSISGVQMQTIFRNPLAGPYILGISSGASLGVAIVIFGASTFFSFVDFSIFGSWLIIIAAWLGSGILLALILMISFRIKDVLTILILGILFGYATSAIVNILQYVSPDSSLKSFFIWTMGSLGSVSKTELNIFIPIIIIGIIISLILSKTLNILMLGEDYARTLGINIFKSRLLIFLSTSLLAGSIAAFCGPIGFIGVTVPHIVRMLFKTSNSFTLQIFSIFIGAIIMLIADIITRISFIEGELPINSITALFGIPIIIYVLINNRKVISV